jgi:protein subunit release factor A
VTDHRGFKFYDLRGCIEGSSLEELIEGVFKVVQEQELEEAIALDEAINE